LYAVFKVGWRAIREADSDADRTIVAALVSAVAAFVVFAMSEPVLFSRYGWVPAALLLAFRVVQVRERDPQRSTGERPRASRPLTTRAGAYGVAPAASGLNRA